MDFYLERFCCSSQQTVLVFLLNISLPPVPYPLPQGEDRLEQISHSATSSRHEGLNLSPRVVGSRCDGNRWN